MRIDESMELGSSNSRSKKLEKRGLLYTKLYLIGLIGGLPVLGFFGIVSFKTMALNEVGDFLAGAFGPLALFWLVMGFFQQGEELRNSVEALKLQANELKDSVEQQKALVEITTSQLELDQKARQAEAEIMLEHRMPHIMVSFGSVASGSSGSSIEIKLKNTGASAQSVRVLFPSSNSEIKSKRESVYHGFSAEEEKQFRLKLTMADPSSFSAELQIISENIRNEEKTQFFKIDFPNVSQVETKLGIT